MRGFVLTKLQFYVNFVIHCTLNKTQTLAYHGGIVCGVGLLRHWQSCWEAGFCQAFIQQAFLPQYGPQLSLE